MSPDIWKMARIAVIALAMAASTTVGWAQVEVSAGYDLFTTDPDTTDLLGIPFVGDDSAKPTFDFVPPPDSADARKAIGPTDTIVHRLETASVETAPGTADPIAIELVMLRLVSTIEFDVDGDADFVYVTLQKDRDPAGEVRMNFDPPPPGVIEEDVLPGPRSFGEMTITFDSAAGGTFDSELLIFADLRFGAPDGPIVCGENAGLPACGDFDAGLVLQSIDSPWARDTPPQSITIRGINFSLAAPDRNTPVDVSKDFWAGLDPVTGVVVCVNHQGHEDPGGAPTAHGTCCPPCFPEPVTPELCRNGKDDNCNGDIDECEEDQFGPVVTAPDDQTFECPHPDVSPGVTGFATGTDNCFPPDLPPGNIDYTDFRTELCGDTFDVDRVWTATDDCGNDASAPDLQQIRVVDTTPPDVTCPPDRVGLEGSILWTDDQSPDALGFATGADLCGGVDIDRDEVSIPGTCRSEEITRTWTATDECGLETPCDQAISVRGPRDSIDDLTLLLEDLDVPDTPQCGKFLKNKIRIASRHACGNRSTAGLNQLDQFLDRLDHRHCSGIDPAARETIRDQAEAIIAAIVSTGDDNEDLCPGGC